MSGVKWRIRKANGSWWAFRPGEVTGYRFKAWRSALYFVAVEQLEAGA